MDKMGLTFKKVKINGKEYDAIIDTGYNDFVLVSKKVAEELGLKPFKEKERTTIDNRKIKVKVAIGELEIDGEKGEVFIEIIDEMPTDVIVGVLALEQLGFYVDPKDGTIKKIGLLAI